jgi:hypothetical protein
MQKLPEVLQHGRRQGSLEELFLLPLRKDFHINAFYLYRPYHKF